MFLLAATAISLEPEWAGVLLAAFTFVLPAMLGGLAWYVKTTQAAANDKSFKEISAEFREAMSDMEHRLEEKISGAIRDASAARANSEATWRNQVTWMDNAHQVPTDHILRPEAKDRAS